MEQASDLQVASGQVLLHVLLEGLLKELLPFFQLDLGARGPSLLRPRGSLRVLRVQLHWGTEKGLDPYIRLQAGGLQDGGRGNRQKALEMLEEPEQHAPKH
ncbi:hypothetical protein EYF80_003870 [Liparis tanakae]|uniref:Uncharacterized protein n=1 Tax=Liparis tanakae TaxID=230148 RepID=A0A4Z2J759_9TELE|nr:hypothetical protein EYF80_003870 [Liparis tanakae]